jgi:hypothetical protein
MSRTKPWVLASILVLAGCGERTPNATGGPALAPVATDTAQATAGFEAAVDALTKGYYRQVPEAATYNGAPAELAGDADARLNDRSVAGDEARVAGLEELLAALKATHAESLDAGHRRIRATLITLFDGALGPTPHRDKGTSIDV